jgi:putative phosphoesterase
MTKILVISDVHGDEAILQDALAQHREDVAAIFYNGDSELAPDLPVFEGVHTVIGNMDDARTFADHNVVTVDGTTIFQTHGHLYNATVLNKWANLDLMAEAAHQANAQIVLFGHTHKLGAEMYDDLLFINPGSPTLPKGDKVVYGGTYALLELTPTQRTVQFYNRQHQVISELTQTFS